MASFTSMIVVADVHLSLLAWICVVSATVVGIGFMKFNATYSPAVERNADDSQNESLPWTAAL